MQAVKHHFVPSHIHHETKIMKARVEAEEVAEAGNQIDGLMVWMEGCEIVFQSVKITKHLSKDNNVKKKYVVEGEEDKKT